MIDRINSEEPNYWTLNPSDIVNERAIKIAACERVIERIKLKIKEYEN